MPDCLLSLLFYLLSLLFLSRLIQKLRETFLAVHHTSTILMQADCYNIKHGTINNTYVSDIDHPYHQFTVNTARHIYPVHWSSSNLHAACSSSANTMPHIHPQYDNGMRT